MSEIGFERDEDFDSERHRSYRDDGWLGGSYIVVPYFLSCLMRINYMRTPREVWEPAAKEYITKQATESAWIIGSSYFHEFIVLILKHHYRESELGRRFPIRTERRKECAARTAISHVRLSLDELAIRLKTTVKQIERNSIAMLARREFARLNPEP